MNDMKTIDWNKAIDTALTVKGSLGDTYNRFYNYSYTNQILLLMQGVNEPVATYDKWRKLKRQVTKHSKGKYIIKPVFYKNDEEDEELAGFKLIKCLFALSDTTGEELPTTTIPEFNLEKALKELKIEEIKFNHLNGNIQGYSKNNQFAINPVAVNPVKTTFHELAHIVLGHTKGVNSDHKGLKEFQAEITAYLIMKELKIPFKEEVSRAYIQDWLNGEKPEVKAIKDVFRAVSKILTAGRKE